jgi:competence protein ComEC
METLRIALGRRPLVAMAIIFAGGILVGSSLDVSSAWLLVATTATLLVAAWLLHRGMRHAAVMLALAGLLAGAFALTLFETPRPDDISRQISRGGVTLTGTVVSPLRFQDDRVTFLLDAEQCAGARVSGRLQVVGDPVALVAHTATDDARPLERGDRVRLVGQLRRPPAAANPGQYSPRARLARQRVWATMAVVDRRQVTYLGAGQVGLLTRATDGFQRRVTGLLESSMPGPYSRALAHLLGSILFGIGASPVAQEIADLFRRAGTIHLLVVSGTQVSLLFGLVYLPGWLEDWRERRRTGMARARRTWGVPNRAGLIVAVMLAGLYAVLCGGGPSIARAAIMAGAVGLAALLSATRVAEGHALEVDRPTLLALAAAVILITRPTALFEPGFQFSFAAVGGMLYLTPRLLAMLWWLPTAPRFLVGATAGAQLAMAPFLAWHFHAVPWAGLVTNLIAVPLVGVLLVTGLTACLVSFVSVAVAHAVNLFNWVLLYLLVRGTAVLAGALGEPPQFWSRSLPGYFLYGAAVAGLAEIGARWAQRRAAETSEASAAHRS